MSKKICHSAYENIYLPKYRPSFLKTETFYFIFRHYNVYNYIEGNNYCIKIEI